MSHNAGTRLQLRLPHVSTLALYPDRAHAGASFFVQRPGKVNDRTAGITGAFPVLADTRRVGGEEGEIHVRKLLCAHALDEVDFVAGRFELADRLVIVKQANIYRGEVALIEHFSDFFPLERGSTHDGHAVELPACRSGKGRSRDFRRCTHEVCEAS